MEPAPNAGKKSPLSLHLFLREEASCNGCNKRAPIARSEYSDETSWAVHEMSGTPWRKRPKISARHQHQSQLHNSKAAMVPVTRKSETKEPVAIKTDKNPFTEEQLRVIRLVVEEDKSVFFTGAAGTGKSYVLMEIIKQLNEAGRGASTFVTGTTGIAACNIGGVTIHSFAGCGLGDEPVDRMVQRATTSSQTKKRWRQCRTLIIDEISMMDADLFEKLAIVGSRARDYPAPFGGIQLVLCGDFFQLPPIGIDHRPNVRFCFEAGVWPKIIHENVILSAVHRQREPEFIRLLNDVRTGTPSQQTIALLQSRNRASFLQSSTSSAQPSVKPTKLFSRNDQVDAMNESELRKLPATAANSRVYSAEDFGDDRHITNLRKNCPAVEILRLVVGAQVMLLKNLDVSRGLVNGSRGVIIGFKNPNYERNDKYFPDEVIWDVDDWSPLPEVHFTVVGNNGQRRVVKTLIEPREWSITMGNTKVASRLQVPLRCAYAISIHKAQGMTIPALEVNLGGAFEYGQAYVALSRATDLSSLTLKNFSPGTIRAHSRVCTFYKLLADQQRQKQIAPEIGQSLSSIESSSVFSNGRKHGSLSSVVGTCRPLQNWDAISAANVDNTGGWMTKKIPQCETSKDTWMNVSTSSSGSGRAPTVTASMTTGSSMRSEKQATPIWSLPTMSRNTPLKGITQTSSMSRKDDQVRQYPARNTRFDFCDNKSESKLNSSVLERIAQNKARAVALLKRKKKIPY